MSQDTTIEWADDTVNPWWGCTKVSEGCRHCYAQTIDARFKPGGEAHWGPKAPRHIRVDAAIADLERIARRSDREGRRRRVFIASMADLFEGRPDLTEPRKRLWDALHRLAGDDPRITPLILSKRPDVMAAWAAEHGWPSGAMAGTSVEDQATADERIPHLLRVPARRFLSMEPLLGPVTTHRCTWPIPPMAGIDWVIVGGESGPDARPMHPDWVRSIRDQCQNAVVPFLFKQWGTFRPWSKDDPALPIYCVRVDGGVVGHPDPGVHKARMARVGKRAAGRTLDGRTWDEVPS